MTQVKVFSAPSGEKVEELVNEWLAKHKLISIIDIKLSSCAAVTSGSPLLTRYSAMVIYQCASTEEARK